ncbi:PEPxxWA-CTERM sorting domain-containing protein [Phenylobacterium sp.]|uniref:PEPxxWA-CTERM sorting domain-containing protein n=1 Tax=Phenylobacterium sp. TaxID=1871053 RepID=UPI00286ABA79|nr:PEPxxWA-CTERM sorting domain-containing protein [Phenylobacterium sp.]
MNSRTLSVALCALTASIALSATGAGAVGIVNGGFEADAASVPASGVYFGAITGWNSPGYLISAGYYSATPPEGRIFALLGNGIDTGGYHLSQTITGLTSGSRYTVQFSLASEDFVIPGTIEQVNVWMSAGSTSASQLYSAPVSSNTTPYGSGPLWDHWGVFNYSFLANAASATIDFQQTAATRGSGDTGLDKLSIFAASGGVPEPGSWALMLIGFGALGATLRRRRAMVAA